MPNPDYRFDGDLGFVIEQYNEAAPFASFLPGIAGFHGIPAWAFYVNRGQGLASFGVRNKDGAFLEFFPADKAYQLTALRGFRTFLKIDDGKDLTTHEPFQRNLGPTIVQRLHVKAHEFSVEEIHPGLGLTVRADMFTLPDAPVAGLVRRVTVQNTGATDKTLQIVDGLPQVLPYGLNQWCVKFMSRTIEAYMQVEGWQADSPFYRLKVFPTDTPIVERVEAGNFFVGLFDGQRSKAIIDAERVFGLAGDFLTPERFYTDAPLDFSAQVAGNRNPSALQYLAFPLAAGESRVYYAVYGHAESWQILQAFLADLNPPYLEAKREGNRQIVAGIAQRAFTKTAHPLLDAYTRQCYLDNGMRGGFPFAVPGGKHLYLFGRKHGDLERDYNDFLLPDSPYSEGNGDFRDVLQNRRMDLFFEPELDAQTIQYFFNLIQADGFNPMLLRNWRFAVQADKFKPYFRQFPGLEKLLSKPFKYAQLWQVLQPYTQDPEPILNPILAKAEDIEDIDFDRGYWSDHWTYLVDLLETYSAIFPDRVNGLLHERHYSFYDPVHFVLPRRRKYHKTDLGIRQYGSLEESEKKRALIQSRPTHPHRVRATAGHGDIVYTSLLGKILTLVTNKLASLDPAGIGIEMEADRPGWCDAMNGLPGLLGSSVNETIELKRLVDYTLANLAEGQDELALPVELAEFMGGLEDLLNQPTITPMQFWQHSHDLKETYRDKVFFGFDGAEQIKTITAIKTFLGTVSRFVGKAIAKAMTGNRITTYFAYEATRYSGKPNGDLLIEEFHQHALPMFLEGFVHALRLATPDLAQKLYQAVCDSDLHDGKLGMFKVNVPLGEDALDLGRIGIFNYGWLENGSVFLHMHYKFVLETARRGLLDEFYRHIQQWLIPFRDPSEYRRSTLENVSFLVSGGFAVDPREHGRGCVARLSGSTVEWLHLWVYLFLGDSPFSLQSGQLVFRPSPKLSKDFFTLQEETVHVFGREESIPANAAACALFGNVLLAYINPQRRDTFGENAAVPCRFTLYDHNGGIHSVTAGELTSELAKGLRQRLYRRLDVWLG